MDWIGFGKRLAVALLICIPLALVLAYFFFGGTLHVLNFYTFGLASFFIGIIIVIFGACLRTPFIEALATRRYAVNPQQTRDTVRHYSRRREEQSDSSVLLIVTGVILISIALVSFGLNSLVPI